MKLGVNDAGRIPCARSKHHPAHPHNEPCDYCEPGMAVDPDDDKDALTPFDPFGAWSLLWA